MDRYIYVDIHRDIFLSNSISLENSNSKFIFIDDGLIFKNGQPNRKCKAVFLITLF